METQHELLKEQGKAAKKNRIFITVMVILTFLGVALSTVLQIIEVLNIKLF